jgi:uncharacterized protein YidB (DUF937 family)
MMGLMDVLNGMQNGPRGQRHPANRTSGGGMSPLTMALIGLLAYKALKHFGGSQQTAPAGDRPTAAPAPAPGGSLADVLKGGLGGLLPGGAGGSVLNGGLNDIIKQLEQSGHGDIARSWVGTGPNRQISPADLEKALGSEKVNSLAEQAGVSKIDLLSGMSDQLPELVDQLTPHGRMPTDTEASRWV